MLPHVSLAIIRSAHPGWTRVRTGLVTHANMRVIADAEIVSGSRLELGCLPDVILCATDLAGYHPISLLDALQTSSPDSRVILLGPVADLDATTLLALQERGLRGCLVWEESHPATVAHAILAVQSGELLVTSPVVLAIFRAGLDRRRRPRVDGLVLTPDERVNLFNPATGLPLLLSAREQSVLRRLLQGQTQEQIARAEGISVRTVEKRISVLKEKFGVSTTLMLGVMTERMGLLV